MNICSSMSVALIFSGAILGVITTLVSYIMWRADDMPSALTYGLGFGGLAVLFIAVGFLGVAAP